MASTGSKYTLLITPASINSYIFRKNIVQEDGKVAPMTHLNYPQEKKKSLEVNYLLVQCEGKQRCSLKWPLILLNF